MSRGCLVVDVDREVLRSLLQSFELNLISYLLRNKDLFSTEEIKTPVFRYSGASPVLRWLCGLIKVYRKVAVKWDEHKLESLGFDGVLSKLEDMRYQRAYVDCKTTLMFHQGETVPVLVSDLNLLVAVTGISSKELLHD